MCEAKSPSCHWIEQRMQNTLVRTYSRRFFKILEELNLNLQNFLTNIYDIWNHHFHIANIKPDDHQATAYAGHIVKLEELVEEVNSISVDWSDLDTNNILLNHDDSSRPVSQVTVMPKFPYYRQKGRKRIILFAFLLLLIVVLSCTLGMSSSKEKISLDSMSTVTTTEDTQQPIHWLKLSIPWIWIVRVIICYR